MFALKSIDRDLIKIDSLQLRNSPKIKFLIFSLEKSTVSYAPHNKDWIKEKIYVLLRKQAGK